MKTLFSTKTHAVLDYLTVATFLTLPRMLGFSDRLTNAMTTLALGKLGYTLLTKHEGGALRMLPMKAHLTMDAVAGAGLAALPWLLDEDDDVAKATCAALGIFDIAAAPATETQSPIERQESERMVAVPFRSRQHRRKRARGRQPATSSAA
jgi:hypothetical protein